MSQVEIYNYFHDAECLLHAAGVKVTGRAWHYWQTVAYETGEIPEMVRKAVEQCG